MKLSEGNAMILFAGTQRCAIIIDFQYFCRKHAEREVQCVFGNRAVDGGEGVVASPGSLKSMSLMERAKNRITLVSSGQGRNVKRAAPNVSEKVFQGRIHLSKQIASDTQNVSMIFIRGSEPNTLS